MSAFGDGSISGIIDYGGKFVFLLSIGYRRETNMKRYQWQTASIKLIGSSLPARFPSRADLQKIAAYLDYSLSSRELESVRSAKSQLEAYLRQIQTMAAAA
jgi:hypothetical protein